VWAIMIDSEGFRRRYLGEFEVLVSCRVHCLQSKAPRVSNPLAKPLEAEAFVIQARSLSNLAQP